MVELIKLADNPAIDFDDEDLLRTVASVGNFMLEGSPCQKPNLRIESSNGSSRKAGSA
jgi:hypothetical protein